MITDILKIKNNKKPRGDIVPDGTGAVPGSQNSLSDHQWECVLRGPGCALECQCDVRFLHVNIKQPQRRQSGSNTRIKSQFE